MPPNSQEEILYILMDFAKHGELFDVIAQTGSFSERVARHYMLELLNAVAYMHEEAEVCHLDLKPQNLLLDENFKLKVADFGFSTSLHGKKAMSKFRGTAGYMTPQQLAKRRYSGKHADLFAVSVILFMMVTQCQPFEKAEVTDPCYRLIAGNKPKAFW